MILNSILKIILGISGIIITIIWLIKSSKEPDINNTNYHSSSTFEVFNTSTPRKIGVNDNYSGIKYNLPIKQTDSTTLLKPSQNHNEIQETVLLEKDPN